jgi:hypothetical protein
VTVIHCFGWNFYLWWDAGSMPIGSKNGMLKTVDQDGILASDKMCLDVDERGAKAVEVGCKVVAVCFRICFSLILVENANESRQHERRTNIMQQDRSNRKVV